MLVLSRKVGEKVVIGNGIVVEVLSVSGDVVRVGVVAPRETSVHRFEVFEEIGAANRAATARAQTAPRGAVAGLAARLRTRAEAEGTKGTNSAVCLEGAHAKS